MAGGTQQTLETYGIQQERGFWQVVGDWMTDLAGQQVPGSVVLLIVLVAFAPYIFKLVTSWFNRGAK